MKDRTFNALCLTSEDSHHVSESVPRSTEDRCLTPDDLDSTADVRCLMSDVHHRVLLISNYKPGTGGISGQVEILQRKLRGEGFVVDIFNTKGSILYRLGLFQKLRNCGKAYDVFHVHCCSGWGFLPAVVGIRVGRRLGKRVVLTYHGGGAAGFFAKHKKLVTRYLRKTDVNIVLSGFLGQIFDTYQIPYTVIPNIIELDGTKYRNREVLRPRFISIRSLEPLYNIPCIIKAFAIVKQQLPEATLTIVGDGSERPALERMVQELGLQNVEFVGRVDNHDIYKYLDQADIMISAPHIDNMPVSLLEGFNAGLLVISSRVGGVPYMIEDGVNGLLFEDDDYSALADKMLYSLNSKCLGLVLAAKHSLDNYSWETVKYKLLEIYQ